MITEKIEITERRGGVKTVVYCAALAAFLFISGPLTAQSGDNEDAPKGQLAPGMTLKRMGNKDAYRSVLPDGTQIRYEGDVRVIEGVGEYTARRFLDYDKRLAELSAELKSMREELSGLRKEMSESKREVLASGPNQGQ
jgi:hypothetical protein